MLLDCIKTGAVFAGIEILMAENNRIGEVGVITLHELAKGTNLLKGARVFGFAC